MANAKNDVWFKKALQAHMAGRLDEAAGLYQRLLSKVPRHVAALNNLGAILLQAGDLEGAAGCFEKVLAVDAGNGDAFNNLGLISKARGDLSAAARFFEKALALNPDDADLHTNLGAVLKLRGKVEQALICHQKALAIDPQNVKALNNLGLAFKEMEAWGEAVAALKAALALNPQDEEIYFNLSEIMVSGGILAEAVDLARRARALFPNSLTTAIGAARVMIECGCWEEADPLIAAVLDYPFTTGELALLRHLMLFVNAAAVSADDAAKLHFTCGDLIRRRMAATAPQANFAFEAHLKNQDKIRVGYVSPDFRRHSVGHLFYEILKHHDLGRFEIYCYAIGARQDDVTQKIADRATVFYHAAAMNDLELARRIHQDRIQVLVDLAGYTRDNRLDLFALKPAPVQVTAMGYPHGTGLAQMDYRITDARAEGNGADKHYREKLVRLDGFFLPLPEMKASATPAARNGLGLPPGAFVLASFNAWHKLRPEVLRLWNRILKALDEAYILFSFKHAECAYAQNRLRSYFDAAPQQLVFLPRTAGEEEHRGRYFMADAALDPFPYSGTTTSLEAIGMGVPVVTLKGGRHVQRTTYSLLAYLGLEELAAEDEDDYLAIVTALARRPGYLNNMRVRLSQATSRAYAQGNKGYVCQLEHAFEAMWAAYKKGSSPI